MDFQKIVDAFCTPASIISVQKKESGDILLKKAAEVLKKTFAEGDIYRAGGDEFLIILNDVSEQMLDEKMKQLENKQLYYQRFPKE